MLAEVEKPVPEIEEAWPSQRAAWTALARRPYRRLREEGAGEALPG